MSLTEEGNVDFIRPEEVLKELPLPMDPSGVPVGNSSREIIADTIAAPAGKVCRRVVKVSSPAWTLGPANFAGREIPYLYPSDDSAADRGAVILPRSQSGSIFCPRS